MTQNNKAILVINSGSSSIKFALFPQLDDGHVARHPILQGQIDGIGVQPHVKAKDADGNVLENKDLDVAAGEHQHQLTLEWLLDWLKAHGGDWEVAAVGHRVVHGGDRFAEPLLLTRQRAEELAALIPLAPLHQPHNLAAIKVFFDLAPHTPQVACFDTAFHRTKRREATIFPLPRAFTSTGVKRYGFHGLSYEYISRVLPQHLGEKADDRIIVAHLGNGASMSAIKGRQCVDTSMGFTAVDGLMMGTRTGAMDPGVLLHLMEVEGMDAKRLTKLLYKESGLLGVSGISSDMRTLLASDAPEAKEAVDLFCYRIVCQIGSLTAANGGIDALVFTGGIGEHAAPIRARICRDLAWLGLDFDDQANAQVQGAARISRPGSRLEAHVIPTNEEWVIADHTADMVVRK